MSSRFSRSFLDLRGFLLLLSVLGCYWAVLIYYLGAQWSFFVQYNYGWAVPFLCLYLLRERRIPGSQSFSSSVTATLNHGSSAAPQPRNAEVPKRRLLLLLLFTCALLYAPTRLIHEVNPIWRLTTLLWVFEILGLTLLLIRLVFGWKRMAQLGPAIGFFLVAVPWPSPIEGFVQEHLAFINTGITVELLQSLNIPALQKGNIVELSTGLLGIDKACSGIQSLQASIMISLFFGILHRLGLRRILLLLLSGAALAFSFNVIRTTILGLIAARQGIDAANKWHDPAGVIILVLCFFLLWLAARRLGRALSPRAPLPASPRNGEQDSVSSADPQLPNGSHSTKPSAAESTFNFQRRLASALLAWFILVEVGVELWYRAHDRPAENRIQWAVNWPAKNSSYEPVELKPSVGEMLKFDQGESGRWRESDGSSWQAFFFAWTPTRSLYERVRVSPYHNPEVCNKAAGWKLRANLLPVTLPTGKDFSLQFRRMIFENEGRIMHLFLAVTDCNNPGASPAALRMRRWDSVQAAISGTRLHGQRTLEIAVAGIEDPEEAKSALQRQLEKLIVVQSRPPS